MRVAALCIVLVCFVKDYIVFLERRRKEKEESSITKFKVVQCIDRSGRDDIQSRVSVQMIVSHAGNCSLSLVMTPQLLAVTYRFIISHASLLANRSLINIFFLLLQMMDGLH